MEEVPEKSDSWSSEANWAIAHGSLQASVTLDSSDSQVDDSTVKSSPLVLKPSSPDCDPCEIKISFTQKHEVRQVYIRSTARVYEIYSAPALQNSNEYLCTVRCGIAARDGEVLHAADIEEPAANLKGSTGELAKEKFKREGSVGSSNEDDWVEVKVPEYPLPEKRITPLQEKIDANGGAIIQDFYEATAEITDVDPCISLTLRLLSLQNKECVYVDEIYIFADPVESADSEQSVAGNPAGSSLAAMLVPTLLQLSKTGVTRIQDKHSSEKPEKQKYEEIVSRTSQVQDKHDSCIMEKPDSLEIGSRTINSSNIATTSKQEDISGIADQQDQKLQDGNGVTADHVISELVLDKEELHGSIAKNDLPSSQIERTLEQLVCQVSRIEDICSRFEEKMLKPISIIEARLQRVEQQMEVFTKNSQCSVLTSGTRFSAPAFPCSESGSSSFYNDGSDYSACGALDKKKDSPSVNLPNRPEDVSTSVNVTQFVPSLVVTAPEFSCGEDEDETDALKSQINPPQEKSTQRLSVDDALAAVLNRLISTSTLQTTKCTQTFAVNAPEFTVEENDDEIGSTSDQKENPVVPFISLSEYKSTECTIESVSTSCDAASVEGICMKDPNGDNFGEKPEGLDAENQFGEEGSSCGSLGTSGDCPPIQVKHDSENAKDCQVSEESKRRENVMNIMKQYLGNQTEDHFTTLEKGVAGSTEDIVEKGSGKDLLHAVVKSSCASSTLDFQTPILDVKFVPCEISSTKTPLEALLADVPKCDVETPHVQESSGSVEHKKLVSVEDSESIASLTDDRLLVDLGGHDVPSTMEREELQDCRACNSDVTCTSLK